jgi:hypothetical protein
MDEVKELANFYRFFRGRIEVEASWLGDLHELAEDHPG